MSWKVWVKDQPSYEQSAHFPEHCSSYLWHESLSLALPLEFRLRRSGSAELSRAPAGQSRLLEIGAMKN
jgi:hypothetical protein